MPNQFGMPEITVNDLVDKQEAGEKFVLLDVRETHEHARATLGEAAVNVPLSELGQKGLEALPEVAADPSAEIVVMCHHGGRSAQVTAWLRQNGWTNVHNLDGGIHAYALLIDPSVGMY